MAKKIRLTRVELKRYRDALGRYERYLPMLKLKQQQLQLTVREVIRRRRAARAEAEAVHERIEPYRRVLADSAGVNVSKLAEPAEVRAHEENVAGVRIPVPARFNVANALVAAAACLESGVTFDDVCRGLEAMPQGVEVQSRSP